MEQCVVADESAFESRSSVLEGMDRARSGRV
jgi:hypothetical protein